MATSSSVILLIVAGSFLGVAYGGDKLHVPPAQDISSFTFQLRTIYGNSSMSNGSLHTNLTGGHGKEGLRLLPADDNLNIYALPVGQGDCTVIQCPSRDGNVITIIDAGSSRVTGFTRDDLVNFLELNEVTINSIFLTHPDEDHIKYIDDILKAYKDNVTVYHSCDWGKYTERTRAKVNSSYAREIRVPYCCGQNCNQNQHSRILCEKSGVRLKVIGSEYNNNNCANEDKNGDSIVSIIEYGQVKTLITGDFEGDENFINRYLDCVGRGPDSYLRANIFRLSHHGADNEKANQRNFLNAIKPEYVFSSSGLKDNYGHPRCSLYHYFNSGELKLTEEVQSHPYTCYRWRYFKCDYDVTAPIYVTTVRQRRRLLNYVIKNYEIRFSINENGHITSRARLV